MPEPGAPPATDPAQPPQAAAGTDPGAGLPPTPPPQSSAASDIPGTATKPGDPPTARAKPATPSAQDPAAAAAKPFRPQLDPAGSSKRIQNILSKPPEQRGHANTQADLAVAAKVATDRVKELQNQPGPLSEGQKQELAACQAALARLQQETSPPPQAADGGPQDSNLVPVGGGDNPNKPKAGAAAVEPPAESTANPPSTVGQMVNKPDATSPDVPMASAGGSPPPPTAPPLPEPPPTATPALPAEAGTPASGALTGTTGASPPPLWGSFPAPIPSSGTPSASAATAGGISTASTAAPGSSRPPYPIDHEHIIKAEFNKKGKATGGHSLLNGDVRVIPGTEGPPNAHGVYEAEVEMKKADGTWVKKKSNKSVNTMFPKHWTAGQIQAEVQAAWDSPNNVIDHVDGSWSSVSPSGVKIEGYIDKTNGRVTAYPVY